MGDTSLANMLDSKPYLPSLSCFACTPSSGTTIVLFLPLVVSCPRVFPNQPSSRFTFLCSYIPLNACASCCSHDIGHHQRWAKHHREYSSRPSLRA